MADVVPLKYRMRNPRTKIAQDFQTVWHTDAGRRVLSHLMDRSSLLAAIKIELPDGTLVDPTDAVTIALAEGQRRMGVYIAQMLVTRINETEFPRDVWQGVDDLFR